jgi:DNA-binding transcriptional MerR regulator
MKSRRATEARYPIRAVSRLTGVGIDTLRAWERRYGAVTPSRDDRGRLYSESDIARLRLLHQAVLGGHGIGRVAALSNEELRRLQRVAVAAPAATVDGGFRAALARFDGVAIDRELGRLAAVLAPADLVRDILLPAIRDVGDQWNRGRGGIAREHLMSAAMRHLLGSYLRLHAQPLAAARVIFATPSGDRHEIGTLGAAMLAASRGFGVTYLGPDLPAAQIVDAARAAGNVSVLVVGATLSTRVLPGELRTLVEDLPRGIELWIGGAGAARHRRLISTRGLVLESFDAYLEQLGRLAGRAA